MTKKQKKQLRRIVIASVLLGAVFGAEKIFTPAWYVLLPLYLIPYLVVGTPVLIKSFKNLKNGQMLDENFLMTVATVGALALREFPEAVFVMLFYEVGSLCESLAVGKSRRSIGEMMAIKPETARVLRQGREETVSPEEVEVGETILVRPGEKIPLDGVISTGSSALNTVALTGESVPREVNAGDEVVSGCVNLSGVLTVRVTKRYEDGTVAKILELVENSASVKSRSEAFIARFARVYTPAVVLLALAVALIPPLFVGAWGDWIHRGLVMLVVSCPCALVLSVPLTFFCGIGGASRSGILVKGSEFLEKLAKTDCVAMDKTGTLTKGEFRVREILGDADTLPLAASVEAFSDHPIAQSLRQAFDGELLPVENVTELSGHGVRASVDGKTVLVGNRKLMMQNGIDVPEPDETCVFVAYGGALKGRIVIGDSLKETAKDAVEALEKQGCEVVMLTGDAPGAAKRAASELGLTRYRAQLLPQEKVEAVEELIRTHKVTGFVGDGINDAPVLARADVGIAMGALGSDAAIEAADIVLMRDDPRSVASARRIAVRTRRIVTENVVFALAVKAAVLILSALNLTGMSLAVFADVGVLVLAVLNAMRAMKRE